MRTFRKRRRGEPSPSASDDNIASSSNVAVEQALVGPHSLPSFGHGQGSTTALSVTKLVLSLTEAAAEAIPIAGPPIKAAISGVLKILELFDVSDVLVFWDIRVDAEEH